MYFLFWLIIFGFAYIVYACKHKASPEERLSNLKKMEESLKCEKEFCEKELEDLKKMKNVIPSIRDSLIEKKLTTPEVEDLNSKYDDRIKEFAKNTKSKKKYFTSLYEEMSDFLKIENIEFADEVDEAQKHFNATVEGIYGEAATFCELSNYHELIVLDSINLPYNYLNSYTQDNQIDFIVINCRGIFLLEVKNYFPSKMYDASTITYEINNQGYLELNSDTYEHSVYTKRNGIQRQMELHKQALADVLEKHDKVNYIKFIHNVCVIPDTIIPAKVKTIGEELITESRLYSEVLNAPNICLSHDEIKELEQIINNENQEERIYTYTVMKDIPDNVLEYMLNYKRCFHPHRRSIAELNYEINNIENKVKNIEEKISEF